MLNKSFLKKPLKLALNKNVLNLAQSDNPFESLSFYNDLMIFEPKNSILDGSNIIEIPDTVGSGVKLEQTDVSRRPTLNNGIISLGAVNTENKGLKTSQEITYREVFITASYDLGLDDDLEIAFSNFPTLMAGTKGLDERRIAADGRTGREDDMLTSVSVHSNGFVRIGSTQVDVRLDVLPLPLSIISSAVNDFTTVLSETDTVTIGYSNEHETRAWTGRLGTVIFSTVPLLNSQRLELIQKMQ